MLPNDMLLRRENREEIAELLDLDLNEMTALTEEATDKVSD